MKCPVCGSVVRRDGALYYCSARARCDWPGILAKHLPGGPVAKAPQVRGPVATWALEYLRERYPHPVHVQVLYDQVEADGAGTWKALKYSLQVLKKRGLLENPERGLWVLAESQAS